MVVSVNHYQIGRIIDFLAFCSLEKFISFDSYHPFIVPQISVNYEHGTDPNESILLDM